MLNSRDMLRDQLLAAEVNILSSGAGARFGAIGARNDSGSEIIMVKSS